MKITIQNKKNGKEDMKKNSLNSKAAIQQIGSNFLNTPNQNKGKANKLSNTQTISSSANK